MGVMINGTYLIDDPTPQTDAEGEFQRARANIRNWITRTGVPGPTGEGGFEPSAGRYHLFAAWNCPWAHRALLARVFKNLQSEIAVSYAAPRRTDQGWVFEPDGEFSDPLWGLSAIHQVYARHRPAYTGRITVPILWDTLTDRAVSNESGDIVRMLDRCFGTAPTLSPPSIVEQIDVWNAQIYRTVNNGVYRAGFARTQKAYDTAVHEVFETIELIEQTLSQSRYLTGEQFTEADLRLFPTLARFDVAYHYAFKCNIRRIVDYPNLWAYARDIYQMPGVAETVRFDIYKQGYFSPSKLRNPLGIVPAGPMNDWEMPHGRH